MAISNAQAVNDTRSSASLCRWRFVHLVQIRLAELAIALALLLDARGTDWYISTSGDNAASGSESEPLATLDYALGKVLPGDTIQLASGTYEDSAVTKVSGTATLPITIRGPVGAGAIVGPGRLSIRHSYYVVRHLHIRSNYLALQGPDCIGNVIVSNVFSSGSQGLYMQRENADTSGTNGPSFNQILLNRFTSLVGNGAVVAIGTSNVVSSNLFADLNGYDALRVWGVGTRISDNRFERVISGTEAGHDNHADVIQTFASSASGLWAVGIVFESNVLVDCTSQFGNLEAQYDNRNMGWWTFRNNLFINSRLQINNYLPGLSFYNNTAISNLWSLGFRFAFSTNKGQAHSGRVFNNIFVRCNGVYSFADGLTNCVADYNLMTGIGDEVKTMPQEGPHGITGGYRPDQIFEDFLQMDFGLKPDSPARGVGVVPLAFLYDASARTGPYDMGAKVPERPKRMKVLTK